MHAQVFQPQPGWERVIDQRPRGFADEHLAPAAGRRHSRGAMDVEAEIFIADQRGLAGVDADTYAHRAALRPLVRMERLLYGSRADAGLQRAAEHDEEGIALSAELVATVVGERLALDRMMREEDIRVPVAKLLDQPCRPFDVAEEEGNGAGWQRCHAGDPAPLNTGSRIARSSPWYSGTLKSSSGCGGMACSATDRTFRMYTTGYG